MTTRIVDAWHAVVAKLRDPHTIDLTRPGAAATPAERQLLALAAVMVATHGIRSGTRATVVRIDTLRERRAARLRGEETA